VNIKTVTTFNERLYDEYAHRFMSTYNWPFELIVYSEDEIPDVKTFNTFDLIPKCKEFVERNKVREVPNRQGDTFKFDAVRFCYKVYVYTHEILKQIQLGTDGLICIDADSVFYNPIDIEWMKQHIHRDDCMLTYLGRPRPNYSECGYLYFNLKHPHTKLFAEAMKVMYDFDLVYKLQEYHDSWVWDEVRLKFEKEGTLNYNISDNQKGHVQCRSVLGQVYDHTKGPRKLTGRSREFNGNE
jgi:hypothetical protein